MNQPAEIKILLVEDDIVDALSVQNEFKKMADPMRPTFSIEIAKNGVEALNRLYGLNGETKLDLPTVILVDIRMPKMGGIDFIKKLRSDHGFNDVHIYLLTAMYGTDDKVATQSLNVAGRIVKPLQHDDALRIYMNAVGLSV